jgi:pimeloyl-ACP methyl ester carboxylesterase
MIPDSVQREFVGLETPTAPPRTGSAYPTQGLYWTPKGGKRPRVAVISTHYNVDMTDHYIAPYFAERGLGFLGWNTRYRGAEDFFLLEHAIVDIGVGINYLRSHGVEKVVIMGNSGGGSLMGAYQAEAMNPTLTAKHKGVLSEALSKLNPADLYISLNAHVGRPQVLTAWLDPSVTDETDPVATDPSLDPFNPDNGPPYSQEFITRFRAAQEARNRKITKWAQEELKRLNANNIPDRIFPIFRRQADLRFMDLSIDPSDRKLGCQTGDPKVVNRGFTGIGRTSTLNTWLSMWGLDTSHCGGEAQLARITVPSLVIQGTGDKCVFLSDAHRMHAALAAKDKGLHLVPGEHYFEGNPKKERPEVADLMTGWINQRV